MFLFSKKGGIFLVKNNTNDGLLLLNKLYQLRQEIYEEGTALFHQWKDQITNASFIESARNLAFIWL